MDLLLCSVSGGNFASQLAGLHCLLKSGYSPEVILGASGGSVTISCLIYCQGNYRRISVLLNIISYRDFVREWVKPFPWWMIGPFQGAAFQHTFGLIDIEIGRAHV